MKISILVGVTSVLQVVSALAVGPRQVGGNGVIAAPVWRRDQSRSVENDLARRDLLVKRQTANTVPVALDNPPSKLLYFANITIGTPAQKIALQLDTGSSDIWVQVPTSQFCQQNGDPCASGTYNNLTSSTYVYVNSDFQIQYADGTQAAGDYATETFQIGSATVTKMEFGVGTDATSQDGVMGVGFALNEAILQFGLQPYPNLVDQMVSQNHIQSRTYSLYLDDIDASTGSILFGGVDTDKFSGTLSTFPINTDGSGTANQFVITLTGLSLSPPSGSTTGIGSSSLFPVNVLLDSGSSYISLPTGMATALATAMGATFSRQLGGYLLPNCNSQFSSGSLNFFFSGVQISVPYDELIVNPTATDGSTFLYNDGSPACMLGILSGTSDNIAVLGDTFLRSAYVVYDLDNQEISLAPTKFNSTSSNVLAIPSGKNQVPSATVVSGATTLAVGTLAPSQIPNGETPTGTGGAIGTVTGSTSSSGSSSAASGFGLYGSGTTLLMGMSMSMCVVLGAWLAL